jgi:hypothetical protein
MRFYAFMHFTGAIPYGTLADKCFSDKFKQNIYRQKDKYFEMVKTAYKILIHIKKPSRFRKVFYY